jgi:hypothetical protein
MAVIYHCRHCGNTIGTIDQSYVNLEQLGLHQLSNEERMEMVSYDNKGNLNIKAICEHCEEALNRNPAYHEMDTFIQ